MPRLFPFLLGAAVALFASASAVEPSAHTLPIFFFHGLTANAQIGNNLKANLSTDARPFEALTFCQDECSLGELNHQTDLAIAQIRNITASDTRFAKGYVFIGHSQGGAIARAVIENMDDHKVHTLISLAGAGNGIFYGPQASDLAAAQVFLKYFSPFFDPAVIHFSNCTEADLESGQMQLDLIKLHMTRHEYEDQLTRSPVKSEWRKYGTYIPRMNNLEPATTPEIVAEQARRKTNFLKLHEAHFFASPFDETISPWQSSILGQYNDVASYNELVAEYKNLTIVPMTDSEEYVEDTYGLQTLDKRGGLFLHTVENVVHTCWVIDATGPRSDTPCEFMPTYAQSYYPLLAPPAEAHRAQPDRLSC